MRQLATVLMYIIVGAWVAGLLFTVFLTVPRNTDRIEAIETAQTEMTGEAK